MTIARKHDRRLGLCAADLVVVRFMVDEIAIMGEIQSEIEDVIDESGLLDDAPFEWITLSLRFGLKNERAPHYKRINKTYGDLPMAIEVDANTLKDLDRDQFKHALTIATLQSLVHAGNKYSLPHDAILERLKETEPGRSGWAGKRRSDSVRQEGMTMTGTRLKQVGQGLEGRLDKAIIDDALEYVDFGEMALAVETLCDQIYEYDVHLSGAELATLREIASEVNAEMKRVDALQELVTEM